MFNIFSKSKGSSTGLEDFSILKADMHSHLLPGIDDGSPDIATSLALVKGMHNLGFNKLITTPHIMWDMYRNTRESILEKEALLNAAIREKGWDIEVKAAALHRGNERGVTSKFKRPRTLAILETAF